MINGRKHREQLQVHNQDYMLVLLILMINKLLQKKKLLKGNVVGLVGCQKGTKNIFFFLYGFDLRIFFSF